MACKRSVANARAHKMAREADKRATAIAAARAAAGSGGLSAARSEELAPTDVTDGAAQPSGELTPEKTSEDGSDDRPDESSALLCAIAARLREERLYAFADPPTYDRLVLSSAAGKDRYQAHVVEAGLAYDGGKAGDEPTQHSHGATAWWTMMDYSLADLRRQGLEPINELGLRKLYARPLREMDRCRGCGDSGRYKVRADPAVLGGPEGDEDAHALVEQMIFESGALSCLLSDEAKARFATKQQPDSHAVAKALEQLKEMGIGMGRKPN